MIRPKSKDSGFVVIPVRVLTETKRRLEELAGRLPMTRTGIAREALRIGLDAIEEQSQGQTPIAVVARLSGQRGGRRKQ